MIRTIQGQTLRIIKILGLSRYENEQDLRFIQTP